MFGKVLPNICENSFLNCLIFFLAKGPGKKDAETYAEDTQGSKLKPFAEIVNDF